MTAECPEFHLGSTVMIVCSNSSSISEEAFRTCHLLPKHEEVGFLGLRPLCDGLRPISIAKLLTWPAARAVIIEQLSE